MTLDRLAIGETALIRTVGGQGSLRQHFLDMGMIPGQEIKLTKYAPLGDPMELLINGYTLTLRKADAARIEVEPVSTPAAGVPSGDDDWLYLGESAHPALAKAADTIRDTTIRSRKTAS